MIGNTTGAKLIRAGVPEGWRVGDKTGRGANGTTNDIAIVRPTNRAPILLCIYTTGATAESGEREEGIAELAQEILRR
jgi:beta-lactamase class A